MAYLFTLTYTMAVLVLTALTLLVKLCDARLNYDTDGIGGPPLIYKHETRNLNGIWGMTCDSNLPNAEIEISFIPIRFIHADSETQERATIIISHDSEILVPNPVVYRNRNLNITQRRYNVVFWDNKNSYVAEYYFNVHKLTMLNAGNYTCYEANCEDCTDSSMGSIVNIRDSHSMYIETNGPLMIIVVFESTKSINVTCIVETYIGGVHMRTYQPHTIIPLDNPYYMRYDWTFRLIGPTLAHRITSKIYGPNGLLSEKTITSNGD